MARIAVCGIATVQEFSRNGEARIIKNVCKSLRSNDHIVKLFGIGNKVELPTGLSKIAAGSFSYDYYYSRFAEFNPDVCLNFTDFDFSAIKAGADLNAKIVMSVNMHHCVCPLWTAFDWNSKYCTSASLHRCLYHTLRSFNNQLITGPMDPLTARLFNGLKLATFFKTRDFLKLVDIFIVPSKGMVDEIKGIGVDKRKIRLIRNGLDLNKWKPGKTRQKDKKTILYYSFPSQEKGADFFLDLAKKFDKPEYKQVRFLMPKIISKRSMPRNVDFIDRWIDQEKQVVDLVRRAYLVIVPSIWEDPSPLVCSESMSVGKPVVGFDTMGLRDQIVDGVTGYLVKNMDAEGLYLRTKEVIDDEKLAEEMGDCGRKRAESEFSLVSSGKKYAQVIEELLMR